MASKQELEEAFPLSIATEADIPSMIPVYKAAFSHNLLSNKTFANVDPSVLDSWLETRYKSHFQKRENRHFKITERSTGKLVAFVRWGYPHVLSEEEKMEREVEKERMKREGDTGWPTGVNMELVAVQFDILDIFRGRYVKDDTTYLAHLLCTDPAYQRKGFASRLLKHVLDIADEEGKPAYIEATPDGHPVYENVGFRDVDSWVVDGRKWGVEVVDTHYVMMRKPVVKV